jgi:hypothetical protein
MLPARVVGAEARNHEQPKAEGRSELALRENLLLSLKTTAEMEATGWKWKPK